MGTLALFPLIVNYLETSYKQEIVYFFGWFLNGVYSAAHQGLFSIFTFSTLVAIWNSVTLLPERYAEFLTAICFHTVQEYMAVMIIGKTIGGVITYKFCSFLFSNDTNRLIIS